MEARLRVEKSLGIRSLKTGDIDALVRLGRDEGWVCDPWEFEIHRRLRLAMGAVAGEGTTVAGCVTAFAHGSAGWIGNLLVDPERRGQGIGTALTKNAVDWLRHRGLPTVLLSAAPGAGSLYHRLGFRPLVSILRWRRPGTAVLPGNEQPIGDRHNLRRILRLDGACWADNRSRLLRLVRAERVCLVTRDDDGFLMFGNFGGHVMLGPGALTWPSPNRVAYLVERALSRTDHRQSVVLDTFPVNRQLAKLLDAWGFSVASSTTLMYRGRRPAIRFHNIIATASLGSMG